MMTAPDLNRAGRTYARGVYPALACRVDNARRCSGRRWAMPTLQEGCRSTAAADQARRPAKRLGAERDGDVSARASVAVAVDHVGRDIGHARGGRAVDHQEVTGREG